MIAGSIKDRAEAVLHPPGINEGVLPVAAIYGANASGKTNVIRAIRFMRDAVKNSHARWDPDRPIAREPFAGGSKSPTMFSVDFLLDRVRYQYGFSVVSERILEEWMYAYPSGKKQSWFTRGRDKPIAFSAKLQGDNRTIERLTRPNSLFLSAAAQNNHGALSPVYRWFTQSLWFVDGERSASDQLARVLYGDAGLQRKLARVLSWADLGVTDLTLREAAIPEERNAPPSTEDRWEIQLLHRIGDSTLPFREDQESNGTVAFLRLLEPVIRVLADGGVVCIDELDQSLHPRLAREVIRWFSGPRNDPASAQLIFNTHDTNLLSAGILRRDQIWFTEKQRDGASQLYPLTDFKPRKQENLENGYLQGRYGAIPFLNADRFLAASHEEER